MKNEAAIAGIGTTAFTKNSGVSELSLACEAIGNCLDDAGLDPAEVDGLVTYTMDSNDEVEVARAVGMGDLTMFAQINYGGGAAVGLIQQAVMAVAAGAAKNVVAWRAMNGRSGQRMGQGVSGNIVSSDLIHWSWYMPYGMLTPVSWVAMIANGYMHEYGVTSEHLAEVAIAQRNFAQNNPAAAGYGKPLSLEQYLDSKLISEPLRLYDCCQETDGGCALLITSTERARDLKQPKTSTPPVSMTPSPRKSLCSWSHSVSVVAARPRILSPMEICVSTVACPITPTVDCYPRPIFTG
jgi:acetyl-CoA acetyltransferase